MQAGNGLVLYMSSNSTSPQFSSILRARWISDQGG